MTADVVGAVITGIPAVIGTGLFAINVAEGGTHLGLEGLVLIVAVPFVISSVLYTASAIHGSRVRRRCLNLPNEIELERQRERDTPKPEPMRRRSETGTSPLHCAITAPDTGACFRDLAGCNDEASRTGGVCEERTTAWCFDMKGIADARATTECAASRDACDARRGAFTRDRTMTVTACGSYEVAR